MDIYVGNLPYATVDADLRELFEIHGTVTSARVIMDKSAGRSKGFGFVDMPEGVEAAAAIKSLNGNDFMGRDLRVNESQPRPRPESRGGYNGGRGGGDRW